MSVTAPAYAQVSWDGSLSTDWFTAGNWTTNTVPGTSDAVLLNTVSPRPTVIAGGSAQTADLTVGQFGTGQLSVETGGAISTTRGYVGRNFGGSGTVTVVGAGSIWNSGNLLVIGGSGTGSLSIEAGGSVTNALSVLGDNFGGAGVGTGTVTVTGTGSTWNSTGNLTIGASGTGTLRIEAGGRVSNTTALLGLASTGVGAVTVTGPTSTWENSSDLYVGYAGAGEMSVEAGGSVSNAAGYIGRSFNGAGVVTVADGSTWTSRDGLYVGFFGRGTLSVASGGTVSSAAGYVGMNPNGVGTARVTGAGSTWVNDTDLYVGFAGAGELIVEAGGRVASTAGYLGGTLIASGSVTVTGPGSAWTSSGSLLVGDSGRGSLTIVDGGTVSVAAGSGQLGIAANPTASGTVSIGGAIGDPAGAPGVLEAAQVIFGAGRGSLVFNHTSARHTFPSAISGPGAISILAGVTELTGDSSGFTGTTTMSNGTLLVNGRLGGTLNVASGRLGGSGTIGSTTIAAGATIAPGNSIGTMTVDGDLDLLSGSVFEVETDPASGASDRIVVTGTANLAGTVLHIGQTGAYAPYSDYVILTASSLNGSFAGASSTFTFLQPLLVYSPTNVTLRLVRNGISLASVARTDNQIAVARALDGVGIGSDLYRALILLDAPTARAGLTQLAGDFHPSVQGALVDGAGTVRSVMLNRFHGGAYRGVAESGPFAAYSAFESAAEVPAGRGLAAWGEVFGSWSRVGGTVGTPSIERDEGGFLVGLDGMVGESIRVGLFGGYGRSTIAADSLNASGESDDVHLGAYATGELGPFRIGAGAIHTWHRIETRRTIAFPGYADALSADYDARRTQFAGEVGYRLGTGGFALEPFAGLAYVHLDTDGFSESGASAALTAQGSTLATAYSTLGLRLSTAFTLRGWQATARAMVGWRHAFGDTQPTTTFRIAGSDAFVVAATPIEEDAAVVEAALDFELREQVTLGIAYGGSFGDRGAAHGATGRLRIEF
ncbi:autotransporter domain-containing protein [Salinarimonas sp.]|uniref:autotransporter outer membrane beta-barrel domain-containing protein n=1 Tax=Salinarimonas sp. TaxID=2766526 RepID=UPI0032D97CE8